MMGLCGALDCVAPAHGVPVHAGIGDMATMLCRHGRRRWFHWHDASAGIALAACGPIRQRDAMPAHSPCGRYVLVLDGVLGNRRELEEALGHRAADATCDAAVLAAAVAAWGLQTSLQRCHGAFACAVWDVQERTLSLARDRAGERALYYGWSGSAFLFGSELKALQAHPMFAATINRDALALLLRFGYIPAPHSIYQEVFKLRPGHMVVLDTAARAAGPSGHDPHASSQAYWCIRQQMQAHARAPGAPSHWVDGLEGVLVPALERCRAARQAGAAVFLSGGTDSSVVAALAQGHSRLPIDTFTLGFDHTGHDERQWATRVARHLGCRHTEQVMGPRQLMDSLAALPEVWCEPFADPSQLPTLLASALVSRHRDVVMTGDGGDELFHGHAAYARAVHNARWARHCPAWLRDALVARYRAAPERARLGGLAAVGAELAAHEVEQHYLVRVSRWRDPACVVLGAREAPTCFSDPAQWLGCGSDAERVRYLDTRMDLAEGVLTKVDRAARAYGLTTRAPLLDLDVMRYAWSLPDAAKYAGGVHKRVLKDLLRRHLPDALVDRPKQGFGPPMATWLAGPLRSWADALLAPARLQREGFFDAAVVGAMWRDFCAGQRKWHTHLWPVLMFQAWYATHRR